MLIRRKSKLFADVVNNANKPEEPKEQVQQGGGELKTSKDLLIEQMRLQRAMLQTQKLRQQVQIKESRERMRQIQNAQRIEQRRSEQEDKNELRRRNMELDDGAKNVSLYKSRSNPVAPVPMKH